MRITTLRKTLSELKKDEKRAFREFSEIKSTDDMLRDNVKMIEFEINELEKRINEKTKLKARIEKKIETLGSRVLKAKREWQDIAKAKYLVEQELENRRK